MFKKVSIIGAGLIGGSFALRIRKVFPKTKIHLVVRRSETVRLAKKLRIADSASQKIDSKIENSDLIIIATPIDLIVKKFKELKPYLNSKTIVTDVGSTKANLVNQIEKIDSDKNFVGAHPMAGSEKTGLENATIDLLKGAAMVLTKTSKTSAAKLNQLKKFSVRLGMKPLIMDSKIHDRAVAGISHLPYFSAVALVQTLFQDKKLERYKKELASTGFRDSTRVSASDPFWGLDVADENCDEVVRHLEQYIKNLNSLKKSIKTRRKNVLKQGLLKVQKYRKNMRFKNG